MPMSKKVFRLKNSAARYQLATEELIQQTEQLLQTLRFIGVESFGDTTLIYRYAQTKAALAQAKGKAQELKGQM